MVRRNPEEPSLPELPAASGDRNDDLGTALEDLWLTRLGTSDAAADASAPVTREPAPRPSRLTPPNPPAPGVPPITTDDLAGFGARIVHQIALRLDAQLKVQQSQIDELSARVDTMADQLEKAIDELAAGIAEQRTARPPFASELVDPPSSEDFADLRRRLEDLRQLFLQ